MDFALSPKVEKTRVAVRAFVEKELIPLESHDVNWGDGENVRLDVLAKLRAKAKKAGIWSLQTPKELGGGGFDMVGMAACYEEMGRALFGPVSFNSAAPDDGNMMVLAKVGTAAQKKKWLLPVVRGEVGPTLFFVAGWRNASGQVHTVSDIVASLVDGSRAEVARVVAAPLLRVLEPGEETWALVVVDPAPPHDVERVTAVEPARPGRAVDEVRLFVDDVVVAGDTVQGRVHHAAAGPVRLTRVVALGFGADGRACAWSEVTPSDTPLQPGQNLAVSVPLGPYRACPEPSWTLRAVGERVP